MRNDTRGFTLAEVMVSLAVMSILGLCLTMILRSGISAWRQGEARTDTTATAQTAMDQLHRDFAAAFTKSIRPPGPVTIEIATRDELINLGIDYFSNEWCTVSYPGGTFDFKLRFATKRARFWISTYGDVTLEANIFTPDDTTWNTLPASGDISELITTASDEATDHIAIRYTTNGTSKVLVGTEGPVLRFTAEPELSGPGKVRLMTRPGLVLFVRNFSRQHDPLAHSNAEQDSSLAEICYLLTFDEARPGTVGTLPDGGTLAGPGELSPTGTLWRAVRQPAGDWPVPEGEEPTEADVSLFEREFVSDVTVLATTANAPDGGTIKVYDRGNMQQQGFYPIAEKVLYFGADAWDNAELTSGNPSWVHAWEPARGTPEKLRIVLTLLPQAARQTVDRLAEPLDADDVTPQTIMESAQGFRAFSANSPLERFVKIGDEWIYYDNIEHGRKLVFDDRGWTQGDAQLEKLLGEPDRPTTNRGRRGTEATDHPAGADVYQGETYVRTIVLPYPKQFETVEPDDVY